MKTERIKIPTARTKNKANGKAAMWCPLAELYDPGRRLPNDNDR